MRSLANDPAALLGLLNLPGVGRKTVQKMLESGSDITAEPDQMLEALFRIKPKMAEKIGVPDLQEALDKAKTTLRNAEKLGIEILVGDQIPDTLRAIPDRPVVLFVKGCKTVLQEPMVAVIGTRKPTEKGRRVANRLGKVLTQKGYVIVSGLAEGCDAAAHRGCLEEKGKTIAVLAHGLDMVYPAGHKDLAEEIIRNHGCLISEYPPGAKPQASYFVERDRLQSGLSLGVFVAETGLKSGTRHTVRFAGLQGKVVACWAPAKENVPTPKSREGNFDLIENEGVSPIAEEGDLERFLDLMLKIDLERQQEQRTDGRTHIQSAKAKSKIRAGQTYETGRLFGEDI